MHLFTKNSLIKNLNSFQEDINTNKILEQNTTTLKEKIKLELKTLVSNLENHEKVFPNQAYGLLGGTSGLILMYYYLGDEDKMYETIKSSLNQLSENNFSYNYSSGIAGLNWVLNFISEEDQNNFDYVTEVKDDLHAMITDIPLDNRFSRNLDFLHGMTGIIHYLVDFGHDKKSIDIILYYLNYINKCKIESKFGHYVTFQSLRDNSLHIDYGLAHGLAALIQVLLKIYTKNIETILSKRLVSGFIEFLLNNKNNPKLTFSHFPISFEEINTSSRLAWCYGDIGIAMAIWRAGVIFNNKEWVKKAEEFFLHSTDRTSIKSTLLYEPMICHGSAGLGLMYNRIYRNTNNQRYKKQSDYWFQKTLDYSTVNGSYYGYGKYKNDEKSWELDYTFLEGSIGIALSYISYLSEEDLKWDRSLLIE